MGHLAYSYWYRDSFPCVILLCIAQLRSHPQPPSVLIPFQRGEKYTLRELHRGIADVQNQSQKLFTTGQIAAMRMDWEKWSKPIQAVGSNVTHAEAHF